MQALVAALLILLLFAAYAAALQLNADSGTVNHRLTIDERDTLYFSVHGGALVLGALVGFAAGKWLNGLGFAYAVLFVTVLFCAMMFAQLGAHTAACHGHNDIFRHWVC